MTQVEHYALSLFFCALIGVLIGVGCKALDDQKQGKPQPLDILFLLGFFVAIAYGFLGFKFVDGRYFIWIVGFISIGMGYHLGKSLATARNENGMRLVLLSVLGIVPALYHYVLS